MASEVKSEIVSHGFVYGPQSYVNLVTGTEYKDMKYYDHDITTKIEMKEEPWYLNGILTKMPDIGLENEGDTVLAYSEKHKESGVMKSEVNEVDIKIEIKDEPSYITEFKASVSDVGLENETADFSVSEGLKLSNTVIKGDGSEIDQIEIKEESWWLERTSIGEKYDEDNSCSDADSHNQVKETALQKAEIPGILASEAVSRLHNEAVCRNSNSASSYFTGSNSGENNYVNIAEASLLLNSRQQRIMLEEAETNCVLNSDVKDCSLIKNYETSKKCEICEKSFEELEEHSISQENKISYKCKNCVNRVTEASDVRRLKLINEEKGLFTCEICRKSFTEALKLKEHKLIHEGKRLHACEICNKYFIRAQNLKQHKLTHDGKRPYACEICNKSFSRASSLKQHKLTHEGKRPYACEICKKSFTLASHVKRHIIIHEGIRPYSCEICNKSYTQTSHLKQHKLSHEGPRSHTCEICFKSFTLASELKRHMLKS